MESVSPLSTIPHLVERLEKSFETGRTRPESWRREQLDGLLALIDEHESDFHEALAEDLGKPSWEAFASETAFLRAEIKVARSELKRWLRPLRVPNGLNTQPGRARILFEPKGVVLNLATWNYPLHIALAPLVPALAAGNCAVVKPSELAPATSKAIAQWLPRYVDSSAIAAVEGGVETATALLEQRFDHIFFTGGTGVGRLVMQAAAERLCPVTLELGGKSPDESSGPST